MMLQRAEVNQKNSEYGNPVGIGSRLRPAAAHKALT
jgi:hypothetical protein